MMLKRKGFMKQLVIFNNPQEAMLVIRCYEGIIKTQNKKAIRHIGKEEQLLKSSKILNLILIILIKADQQFI